MTRHILEVQRRLTDPFGGKPAVPVYGLFIAPRIHPDTANDFFVALKFRVIERQQIAAIPLTLRQFTAMLSPFGGDIPFTPPLLERLLVSLVEAGLAAETGDDWIEGIDGTLRTWLASLGATSAAASLAPAARTRAATPFLAVWPRDQRRHCSW